MAANYTTAQPFNFSNGTVEEIGDNCRVDKSTYYLVLLVPAVLITLALSFTEERKGMFLNAMIGRPQLIYPMDIFTKSDRLSYVCALGATTLLLAKCILGQLHLITYEGPAVLNTLILLVSAVIIGLAFYPIFGSLTAGSVLGFGAGSLYAWTLMLVSLVIMFDCDLPMTARAMKIMISLPSVLSLLCLSIIMPLKCYKNFQHKTGLLSNLSKAKARRQTFMELRHTNIGLHIRDLLRKPKEKKERVGIKDKCVGFLLDVTYRPIPRFRYSARFLSTVFGALFIVYAIFLLLVYIAYQLDAEIEKIVLFVKLTIKDQKMVDSLKDLLGYASRTFTSATVMCFLSALYGIFMLFKSYRYTMLQLNKGQLKDLTRNKKNTSILLAAMKYSGYQIVSVAFGLIIHFLIFLVICGAISASLWAVNNGHMGWLKDLALKFWPIVFWSIIVLGSQMLLARYAFIGHETHLVLDNRRMLFITSYFIFFYNMFLGLFSWLLRFVMSIAISAFMLPRYDASVLPQGFESFDPGYSTYVGFMTLENDLTHPVMLGFIRLLQVLAHERRVHDTTQTPGSDVFGASCENVGINPASKNKQEASSHRRRVIEFKWQTAYTLINNPGLRMHRKGYMQKINRAKELGMVLPKSDAYIDIDEGMLKKAQEEACIQEKDSKNMVKIMATAAGDTFGGIVSRVQNALNINSSADDVVDVDMTGNRSGSAAATGSGSGGSCGSSCRSVESNDTVDGSDTIAFAGVKQKTSAGKRRVV